MPSNITEILVTQVYVDDELLERQPFTRVFTDEEQAADSLAEEGYVGNEFWFAKPKLLLWGKSALRSGTRCTRSLSARG
jgi:hypothetical protein